MKIIQTMLRENKCRNFNTQECFVKLQQGDESQRKKIINQWLGLALKIANSYESMDNCDANDYFSVATEGLIKAVDNFDLSKNIEFSTYATTCIKNEIYKFIKASKKNTFSSLDVPVYDYDPEGDGSKLIDYLADDIDESEYNKIETKLDYEMLYAEMKKILNEKELKVIKLRLGFFNDECLTFRQIDKKLGISGAYELMNRAIIKVQKKLFDQNESNEKTSLVFQTHLAQKAQLVNAMRDELDKVLNEKELAVIRVRYGIVDGKMKKQHEVNQILGISKVHVGELERSALLKLQVANGRKFKDVSLNV